jgi:hypothetical protein
MKQVRRKDVANQYCQRDELVENFELISTRIRIVEKVLDFRRNNESLPVITAGDHNSGQLVSAAGYGSRAGRPNTR